METAIMASGNPKKIKEMSAILRSFNMDVKTKEEAGYGHIEPVEDGETYEENSLKKAMEIMKASGMITIADDSGLEVEYLDGAPGIYSGRFAGEDCNYERNNAKLLSLLDGVPIEKRRAKFVTVITMVFPAGSDDGNDEGTVLVARGECPGHITTELLGEGGFGYDPLFMPDGYDGTFAQLGTDVKNQISHRARAIKELVRLLEEM